MNLICKLFRQDPDSREGIVTATSGLGIVVNLLTALLKVVIGALASSIAILSEGVNNFTDALTSVLTLIGTKLSSKRPDKKHPFGYGRVEYLTSLVIAALILATGTEMLISSVERIFAPEELKISYLTLVIILFSSLIKFFLGIFTIRMGRKTDSGALTAVGIESRNDSFVSLVTIVSALVFLLFGFSIDAYAGIVTSLFILKAGLDVLRETISELLGRPGKEELAKQLYKEIRAQDGVQNAADMMLHNYGPEAYTGSVNVEIDHEKTIGEVYQSLHELQLRIMHEHNVTMVFGIYAVDNEHGETRRLRRDIAGFTSANAHIKSFHALYLEPQTKKIYVDFVVDYELKDWDALKKSFLSFMEQSYPEHEIELTVETEFV